MSSKMRNSEILRSSRTCRPALSETDSAINDFFFSLDTPRSLACWLLYSSGEHQQLVDLDLYPDSYINKFQFRDDYTATSFLSKANFLKLAVSKKDQAMSKFRQYEELCKSTNNRFRNLSLDPAFTGPNVWLLNATIRKIASILGDFSAEELVDEANWGPGVTTLLKGENVSAVNKFHSENGITHDLYALVSPWFKTAYPLWGAHIDESLGGFNLQKGNVIVTVPKNSKTDRVIAVEPGVNLWFQKAAGSMIRRRLARVSVDLNSQEKNQQLSRQASQGLDLATVDFSSASDSISLELVRELLPPRWFLLLDSMRSKIGIDDSSPIHWNKFSSMGNGFTFELESLIFFSAASAVQDYLSIPGEISVFGDDVILPNGCFNLFSSFSEFLGFRVNEQKSFSSGYFRESCGSHYFDGIDCKPIFLKERLQNVESIYKLANNVRRLAHRRNSHYGCDIRFVQCWRNLRRRVHKALALFIPDGVGDGGFIGNFDEATPARARNGIEGYYYLSLIQTGVNQFFEGTGMLLARLKVPSIKEYGNNYTLRGRTRLRVSRSLVRQWYNLGEWI